MLTRSVAVIGIVIIAAGLFSAAAEPEPDDTAQKPAAAAETEPGQTDEDKTPRVPVEVARDRAVLMHDVYSSTLDMIHHRYFRADKAIIPARAMEDIFSDMQRQSGIEARWIAVNLPAMGVDHEPETDFEKQAAKKIAAGDSAVELVDGGYYRRAGAISLNGGCIHCHNGFFRTQSTAPKYAALVISIPVEAPAETAGN